MNRQFAPLNVVQLPLVIVKLMLYFVLPMLAFSVPVVGELFGLKGLDVYRWGNFLGLLPMLLYFLMLIFTIGPLQKLSFIPAIAAFVVEIIIVINAANLLPIETIKMLCMQYFPEYTSSIDLTLSTAARLLLKPGLAFIINMVITILYGMFQFIPVSEFLFGIAPSAGGNGRQYSGSGNNSSSHHMSPPRL